MALKVREILKEEATFELEVEQDDIPLRGNLCATDEPERDKEEEDEAIRRLNNGDVWAWACVKVTATYQGFVGVHYLGGCSYANEKDFRDAGTFDEMCVEALADLNQSVQKMTARLNDLSTMDVTSEV